MATCYTYGAPEGDSFEPCDSVADAKIELTYSDKVVVSIATLLPVVITLLATSEFTSSGRQFYLFLQQQPDWQERSRCYLASGLALIFIGYLVDVHRWNGWPAARRLWVLLAFGCFVVGWLLSTPGHPSAPIILGIIIELACVALVRIFCVSDVVPEKFGQFLGLAKISAGVTLLTTWLIWVYHTNMWGSAAKVQYVSRGHSAHHGFILWSSPAIMAVCLLVYGIFALLWSQVHVDVKRHQLTVGVELKIYLAILMSLGVSLWIVSAVAAEDIGLTKTVKCFFALAVISFAVYVSVRIPWNEFEELTRDDYVVSTLRETLQSDWIKGGCVLFIGPVIPLYFVLECLHSAIRRCLVRVGAERTISDTVESIGNLVTMSVNPGSMRRNVEASTRSDASERTAFNRGSSVLSIDSFGDSAGPRHLVQPARGLWYRMSVHWEWNSILSKAITWGLAYWVVSVITTNGCNLMLAWATERVEGIPLWRVLIILWCVGMFMFLLPPVPGMPIYLCVGSVCVQRLQDMGYGFANGCMLGIIFSFFIKMAATACEQKCIGEVFSKNITIRKFVGTHTLFMRGLAYVLEQPGWRLDKVAILVGGPDWPTSVMTGILRLSVVDMLICSTPVIFVIIPPVLAAAFKLHADQDPNNKEQWNSLATVFLMMTGMILGACSLAAGYSVQRVLQSPDLKENLLKNTSPLDAAVEKEVESDAVHNKAYLQCVCWQECPTWLAFLLLLGDLSMMISVYIVLIPSKLRSGFGSVWLEGKAFAKFEQTDKLSSLEGGLWGLVLPPGQFALALACLAMFCLLMDAIWKFNASRGIKKSAFQSCEEEESLLDKAAPHPVTVPL